VLIIGLTGGIASGKSAASKRFAELGAAVIDADQAARQVVAPGEPGLARVVEAFGRDILTPDGQLDRAALRQQVFNDPGARRRLEQLLHPLIRQRMLRHVQQAEAAGTNPYAVLAIPLLVENRMQELVHRVLVVDAPEQLQRARAQARDNVAPEQIDAIMASQASRSHRLAAAHDIITNTGTLEDLRQAVDALHEKYLTLSANGDMQAPDNG